MKLRFAAFMVFAALGIFALGGVPPAAEQAALAFETADDGLTDYVEIKCLANDVDDLVIPFGYFEERSPGKLEAERTGSQKLHIDFPLVGQEVVSVDTWIETV